MSDTRLAAPVTVEQEIKKSRFIAYLAPVSTLDEARAFFKSISKQHPKATHCCTAVKIGQIEHSNDDGEPSGTAGRPMLDVLKNAPGDGIAAAVIRYFGGTLLGKGGLVRAYSSSVSLAVQEAEWNSFETLQVYSLTCDYSQYGKLEGLLRNNGIEIVDVQYLEAVSITLACKEDPSSLLAPFFKGRMDLKFISTLDSALLGTSSFD